MEHFYLEEPTIMRKQEAIDYIEEHHKYSSRINGSGSLHRYIENYEGWLEKLEEDKKGSKELVPAETYFLIREEDNKIIGMINIRLCLNEALRRSGGHIGYGIRPTERNKGYNKINLYLGLKICEQHGIEKALLDANKENEASWKTMEALGGKRIAEYYDETYTIQRVKYEIPVSESLEAYKEIYEKQTKVR